MEIKRIKKSELQEFTNSFLYKQSKSIPITDLRVLSQINNPFAEDEDVLLTVAYRKGELMGYIGALPTKINEVKTAWNSCWWVSEEAPAGLSMQLLYSFISDSNKQVMFSELTEHTNAILQQMNFCRHEVLWGIRCFFRFCLTTYLPRKYPWTKKLKGLLKIGDKLGNVIVNEWIKRRGRKLPADVTLENLGVPDSESISFIKKHSNVSDRNSEEVFNWIHNYPWLTADIEKELKQDYYFSYNSSHFKSFWIKMKIDGEIAGLLMLVERDSDLKLPYVYVEKKHALNMALCLRRHLRTHKYLSTLTTFHPELVYQLQNVVKGFMHKRRIPKYTAVSNDLYDKLNQQYPDFQMGDGDVVFT